MNNEYGNVKASDNTDFSRAAIRSEILDCGLGFRSGTCQYKGHALDKPLRLSLLIDYLQVHCSTLIKYDSLLQAAGCYVVEKNPQCSNSTIL